MPGGSGKWKWKIHCSELTEQWEKRVNHAKCEQKNPKRQGISPELGSQGSMSSSSLGHSADATSRSSADYGERIQKDINTHIWTHNIYKKKKVCAPHPLLFIFYMCEHTTPILHPLVLYTATNTFAYYSPQQWQAAKTKVPRREEERRKDQRNIDSCLKPQRQLSCPTLLTVPQLCFSSALSIFHTSSIPISPSDIGSCSYVLENGQCEATESSKTTVPFQFSLNIPAKHSMVHLNLLYWTPLHKHNVNNPLTFNL